jgi:hypothetical protein
MIAYIVFPNEGQKNYKECRSVIINDAIQTGLLPIIVDSIKDIPEDYKE